MPCAPRMKGCRAGCLHRQLVESYHDARDAWEQLLEAEAKGYAAEEAEFRERFPPPTFKEWLQGLSRWQ